eukprot:5556106-Alexandrium_andersonii.AAC.1
MARPPARRARSSVLLPLMGSPLLPSAASEGLLRPLPTSTWAGYSPLNALLLLSSRLVPEV